MTAIFGQIILGTDVEAAVLAHLKLWMPTYIAEVERQQQIDPHSLPAIHSYTTANAFKKFVEDQLPALVVISPGMVDGSMYKESGGQYSGKWVVGVGLIAAAQDKPSTGRLAKLYTAAARAAILQHKSLGGFAKGVDWIGESYEDIKVTAQRTLGTGRTFFEVEVSDVTTANNGPSAPLSDPYSVPPDPPSIQEVDIEINKEAISG